MSLRLREMAESDRPQERLERLGAGALSDTELLALLLRSGSKEMDVLAVAHTLLAKAGSLGNLLKWSEADFRKVKGVGKVKAGQLLTVIEVARRILAQESIQEPVLDGAEKVYRYMLSCCAGLEVEKLWVLLLDKKHRILRRVEVSSGILDQTLAHPREVFREAIRQAAASIILVHNHPSGDPSPSAADNRLTEAIKQASSVIMIDLLDHVIIGTADSTNARMPYYSYRERGRL